jgi:AcrR family transcriptional regulator
MGHSIERDDSIAQHDSIEQRTLRAAIELAAEGGFEAVRQREVAARAHVALGTLYSRYSSKELLLISALELEASALERELAHAPVTGATPEIRAGALFAHATRRFVSRPHLGRAILRATVSSDPQCTAKLMQYQARLAKLLVDALLNRGPDALEPALSTAAAQRAAMLLIMIWHSSLVGWSGGAASCETVIAIMEHAARVIVSGVGA